MAGLKKADAGTDVPKYSMAELAAGAASVFNASPDCVTAALRAAGITEATKEEARKIVGKFMAAPVPPASQKGGK